MSELTTTWSEHDAALSRILELAESSLSIFDADLARFERPDNAAILQRFLSAREHRVRIVVRNAAPLRENSPRLWKLLGIYDTAMTVFECPESLVELTDSFVIADDRHGLVRFHEDQPRCKTIVNDALECKPYVQRFEDLVGECGVTVGTTTLGL
jgi:hypothetical protein